MVGERNDADEAGMGRSRRAATDDGETDGMARGILSRYDPETARLASLGNGQSLRDIETRHLDAPTGLAASDAERLAGRYRDAGVDASTFVASHGPAVDGLVAAAFDELRERLDGGTTALDEVEAELSASLADVLSTVEVGAGVYAGASTPTGTRWSGTAVWSG